jgi:transglycosylase-like protein
MQSWMTRGRILGTAIMALIAVVLVSAMGVGSAQAATHAKHKRGDTWRSGNYLCHKYTQRSKGTHCVYKPKHKRVRHSSSHSSAWVLPSRVVMCESGGNPRAINLTAAGRANGTPSGLYQITRPTWLAYGGGRYASEARFASVYQQGVIALKVLHAQGSRAWACW